MKSNQLSQTVVCREGALAELRPLLDTLGARRVLFVVDAAAYAATSAGEQLKAVLQSRETIEFGEFEINPKIKDVKRGIQLFEELRPDVVVAFGGGTAIDLAKMIRGLASHSGDVAEVLSNGMTADVNRTPLVAIPTTAGTGSEATHFAVVYRNGEKFSIAHQGLLPNVVLLDPVLTYSMPPGVTAVTGLDALCQAIESIWAVGASEESVEYAAQSLELSLPNLEQAVHAPTPDVRRAMCEAAHLAGKAINISKTTAPHAMSYWLTTRYGIPHGAAVGVFIGPLLEFNAKVDDSDCNDPRGAADVRRRMERLLSILDARDVPAGRQKVEDLITAIDCPISLQEIGIHDEAAIAELAGRSNVERLTNNPRRLDAGRIVQLMQEAGRVGVRPPHAVGTKKVRAVS
jgi:alcohol dehydrogenase class IV